MNRFVRVMGLAFVASAMVACSETAFMDTLGIGKSVPNEKLVATNPPLSVPPDLRLPPPGQAVANTSADSQAAAVNAQTLATPPADATAAAYGPDAMATQPATTNAPRKTAAATPSRKNDVYDDIFARYGISRYHPDGREKTIAELNRELAEKIKEEKRRKNPNYGTIFNIGSLFK